MNIVSDRTCTGCGATYLLTPEHFPFRSGRFGKRCRPCQRNHDRSLREARPEAVKEAKRRHKERHPERVREAQRAYDATRKEQKRVSDAERWAAQRLARGITPESIAQKKAEALEHKRSRDKLYHSRLYQERKAEINARNLQYYYENKDGARLRGRKWRSENPIAGRMSATIYRARKAQAEGTHTPEDVMAQLERQGNKCFYCETPFDTARSDFHADHFIPLSRGGSNGPENIVCACPACNLSKNNRMPWEFMPHRFQGLK